MKKHSKRGLRIIATVSSVILMSPLFANSSVQIMLGNELNAHADTTKKPDGNKTVKKALNPKRESQNAISSSVKYSHKVPVLNVSLRPTKANYFRKGEQIHFQFNTKNVNLKNLRASYQKSLPFKYSKLNSHELVLTFKKSVNSGIYGQAYAIPTKNKKMTTKVKGTFDKKQLDIKNDKIKSYQQASKVRKSSSKQTTQNTASQQSANTTANTQQNYTNQQTNGTATGNQQSYTNQNTASNYTSGNQLNSTSQGTGSNYTGTASNTTGNTAGTTGSTAGTTTNYNETYSNSTAGTNSNQQSYTTQSTGNSSSGTTATTQKSSVSPQTTSTATQSSSQTAQVSNLPTPSKVTKANPGAAAAGGSNDSTATSKTSQDTSSADSTTDQTNSSSTDSQNQSSNKNVSATDAYNTVLSKTKISQGNSYKGSSAPTTKGYVTTPTPTYNDPQTTYQTYAKQQQSTSDSSTSGNTESNATTQSSGTNNSTTGTTATTGTSTATTDSNQAASTEATTAPTTADANSNGTVSTASAQTGETNNSAADTVASTAETQTPVSTTSNSNGATNSEATTKSSTTKGSTTITPTKAQANSGTASKAATASATVTDTASKSGTSNGTATTANNSNGSTGTSATTSATNSNSSNTSEQNKEGQAIFNNVKSTVSKQTSNWANATEQGEIVKEYPWILHEIASKLPSNPDETGQVWKYEIPLTTGKTALVTVDGRSDNSTAKEGTLEAAMPSLLKSLGKSTKADMFDEAVDIDELKASDYYKQLENQQKSSSNISAIDAYNAVIGQTQVNQGTGAELNGSSYITTPKPTASDPESTYKKYSNQQSSTSSSSDSDTEGQTIFNNIKSKISSQTSNWANETEQGEIIKEYPWILNDISKRISQDSDNSSRVWNYAIPLTTGKTAVITINGKADLADPSSLTFNMPQLLKSIGSSATAGMFDDAVDVDILKGSQYYEQLQASQQSQSTSTTSNATTGTTGTTSSTSSNPLSAISSVLSGLSSLSSLFSSNNTIGNVISGIFNSGNNNTNLLSGLAKVVLPLVVLPAAGSLISNVVSTITSVGNAVSNIAKVVIPIALFTVVPTVLKLAPIAIAVYNFAKPVIDTVSGIVNAINTITTISNVANTINTVGNVVKTAAFLGTVGSTIFALGSAVNTISNVIKFGSALSTLNSIVTAIGNTVKTVISTIATGLLLGGIVPQLLKGIGSSLISGITKTILSPISNFVSFVGGAVLGSINAVSSVLPVLGTIALATPFIATISSAVTGIETVMTVAGIAALATLIGTIAGLSSTFANNPILAGFKIGESLIAMLLATIGRLLFSSVTGTINGFVEGAKKIATALALGTFIPAFVMAPTILKVAMIFLILIPLAGFALKKYLDNIRSGLNAIKQAVNGLVIATPLMPCQMRFLQPSIVLLRTQVVCFQLSLVH